MKVLCSLLCVSLFCVSLSAQWPQWRGPNRDGVVALASVPASWPEKPARVWTQAVGEGYVTAFELATGKPLWTTKYQSAFNKNKYATDMSKGPFSTPIVSKGRLFTLGTSAVLTSLDVATGQVKWRKDWSKEIDTSKLFTGTSMSPIVDSGLLIVHVGDDTSGAFRAFDPLTGVEKWSLTGHGPGYASPVMRGAAGAGRHLITMTDKAVVGLDVSSGKLLWSIPFPDEWNENIVTPVFAGDLVVISGTRQGTFGYRVEKKSTVWTPTKVWHNTEVPMYELAGSWLYCI